jgi:hypothetical protein
MNDELYGWMQNKINSYAEFYGEIRQIALNQYGSTEELRSAIIGAMQRYIERCEAQCDSSEK